MSRISIWVGVCLSAVGPVPMRPMRPVGSGTCPHALRGACPHALRPHAPRCCRGLSPRGVCWGLSPCGGELSRHFIGNCLRLNVLAREDLGAQALADCKGNFLE